MAISPRLGARQTQQLTMTPQLQQAIKLLQMTSVELQQFVETQIEGNPLLELAASDEAEDIERPLSEARDPLVTQFSKTTPSNAPAAFDVGGENLPGDFSGQTGQSGTGSNQIGSNFADDVATQVTLKESLRQQTGLLGLNHTQRSLVSVLIEELDEDGYLRTPIFELCERLGVETPQLEEALVALQSCEPTGVGARNLQECLRLQLRDMGPIQDDYDQVLNNLDALANQGEVRFAEKIGIDPERLEVVMDKLRRLNASPGLIFEQGHTEYAVPEISVQRNNLGGWSVELNSDALPKLLINNQYSALVKDGSSEVSEYVTECASRARWLVNSLNQRAKTVLRVATEIVRQQDAFFSVGVTALKPLVLRDVADNLNLHESTVSRVTTGKYLSCERGNFELKYFFGVGLKGTDGDAAHSATGVRERIRMLIEAEDACKPLSDEGIVRALAENGIIIARRTVTKYREAMNIASSVKRRSRKPPRHKNTA